MNTQEIENNNIEIRLPEILFKDLVKYLPTDDIFKFLFDLYYDKTVFIIDGEEKIYNKESINNLKYSFFKSLLSSFSHSVASVLIDDVEGPDSLDDPFIYILKDPIQVKINKQDYFIKELKYQIKTIKDVKDLLVVTSQVKDYKKYFDLLVSVNGFSEEEENLPLITSTLLWNKLSFRDGFFFISKIIPFFIIT